MKVVTTVAGLSQQLKLIQNLQCTALVPTMGNLHQGHLDLITLAKSRAEFVVVSIFVNPLQFAKGEDLDSYPRSLDADIKELEAAGVDLLFAPTTAEIYGTALELSTQVVVPHLSDLWCGQSRPGHFQGVTTIVNKLFNLVQPNIAVFGQKDWQQLTIIRQMVKDLNMQVEVLSCATRREADGLAMSSRNGYLSPKEREIAPKLREVLVSMQTQINSNTVSDFNMLINTAKQQLEAAGFRSDYLAICRQSDLLPASSKEQPLVILAAAYLGKTRLIDNLLLDK